jgi:hypothetical protein
MQFVSFLKNKTMAAGTPAAQGELQEPESNEHSNMDGFEKNKIVQINYLFQCLAE